MSKNWFQLPEQGAGQKRLILTGYIYKFFGEIPLRIIVFFIATIVFFTAAERRNTSVKYFKILNKNFPIIKSYIRFLNYGNSLADKLISFTGKLKPNLFELDNKNIFQGSFFITTHIGNIEILRSLFYSTDIPNVNRVNIFLQSDACKIFNNFLNTLKTDVNVEAFPVENISIDTSVEIYDRLKSGEIVFMAGDRVSAQNTNEVYETNLFNHKIKFPLGTLKFALMLDVPIYFIICVKEGKNFKIITERFTTESSNKKEKLEELKTAYVEFWRKNVLKYPTQLYNFYEFWEEN